MAAVLRDIDPVLADQMEARFGDRGGDREERGPRGGPERDGRGERDGRDGREAREPREPRVGERSDAADGVRRLFPQIARLVRLKEIDPGMYELRVQDIRLERDTERIVNETRRIRADATVEDADDRIEDLHDELEDKVEAHFELRQEIRAAELERMRARIEQLENDLDRRKDDKDALIAQRLAELRGDPQAR